MVPNKLKNLEHKEDAVLWRLFKDEEMPVSEAPYYYKVVMEAKHFTSDGSRLSTPVIRGFDIETWEDLTVSTGAAKVKYGANRGQAGLNPLAGMTVEVIHDPLMYNEKPAKKEVSKPKEVEATKSVLTLEMIEGADDSSLSSLYIKYVGKQPGRMGAEKKRAILVGQLEN